MKYCHLIACCMIHVVGLTIWSFTPVAVAIDTPFSMYEFGDVPTPQRIAEPEFSFRAAIVDSIFDEMRSGRPVFHHEEGNNLYDLMAKGKYDEVIEGARVNIAKLSPCYDNWQKVDDLARYQFILASAYELNGEWEQALHLYALVYGENSTDFKWAFTRILFATGRKQEAFICACKEIEKVAACASVDSVIAKIEAHRELNPVNISLGISPSSLLYLPAKNGRLNDYEWNFLWKLRDYCARVVCPELHFVSTWRTNSSPSVRRFPILQRESFESFVAFMEEEYAHVDDIFEVENDEAKEVLEFLQRLKQMPYEIYPIHETTESK